MTDDEVTNVTAWLMAQREQNPGQPYPNATASALKMEEKSASGAKH
jgi:hypothetical protein